MSCDDYIAAGQRLEDAGDFEGALRHYRQAVEIAPESVRAHINEGNALARLGQWDGARSAFEKALCCAPDHAPAHFNLGALLFARGEHELAEAALSRALVLAPTMHEAAIMLADLYENRHRFDEAENAFRQALRISPDHRGAMLNFGLYLSRRGCMEESSRWLQRARVGTSEATLADSQLLFGLNFRSDMPAEEIYAAHTAFGRSLRTATGAPFAAWSNSVNPDRRLRLGYVSGDFGPHPVGMFVRPIIEQHDRSQFEIYCYSNSAEDEIIAPTIRQHADHWRPIARLEDEQVAALIRRDEIDVLVDLAGHTNRGRLAVFARRPAPVQVSWLGYLNTTGLDCMDYRIVDSNTDPEGFSQHLHVERLIRMPHSQWCYFAWHDAEVIPFPHPEQSNEIVLGSFNQYAKITDETLQIWAAIFSNIAGCRLVVFDVRDSHAGNRLRDRMCGHGIDIDRVTLRGREPIPEYLRAIGNVDMALDTFPYNGATTALDALWMGVPVVALRGGRGISRGTYSVLETLGAAELIADSPERYVDINTRLARDASWRAHLRATLRGRMQRSPLMDLQGFTMALEHHFRALWRQWCTKRMPRRR